jgi:hypothetical protein
MEIYDCQLQPIFWKGNKAIMVSLENVMEQKIKEKLLVNQSNEISTQFHDILNVVERELVDDDDSDDSSRNASTKVMKSLFYTLNKLYNDFLFIKNLFEIECGDMRTELESFSIKDFFLYSVDLLLNKTKK